MESRTVGIHQAKEAGGVVLSLFKTPAQVAGLFNRAMMLDEDCESWEVARNLYREVVRLAPGHSDAWNNLGVLEHRVGNSAAALDAWGHALQRDPHKAETHNNIGMLFQTELKLEVASVYLLRAVRLDPDMSEARVNLALCLQGLGRRKAALRHWNEYLERWPRGEFAPLVKKHVKLCSAK